MLAFSKYKPVCCSTKKLEFTKNQLFIIIHFTNNF